MAQVALSPGEVPTVHKAPQEQEWQENLNVRLICKDCRQDPPELREDHASGDLICAECGLVLQQRFIDTSSEWRTFSNDDQGNDDPSRVGDGPNALLNGAQLNTNIAFGDGGLRSRELNRAQNKTNIDKGNKSLLQAYKQIGALCDNWQLPNSVSDTAKHLYKQADESKIFRGKSQEALIAGCVFLACRRNGVPRSFREVMELTKVSKKEIGRTFKLLESFLQQKDKDQKGATQVGPGGLSFTLIEIQELLLNCRDQGIVSYNEQYKATATADPGDLCNRFCNQLDMTNEASLVAQEIAKNMKESGALAGRSPLSAAAACIYMAAHLLGQPKTPKEISEIAKVSDGTIRQAYKTLYLDRGKLITPEIENRGADVTKLPKPV